jgi:quinol monooxygenase YgiN
MEMIVVIATFKAKAGQEKELEEALTSIVPDVQKEEGTVMYTIHKSKADPGQFLFYEMYKDKAALEAHSSTPYFKAFAGQIGPFLEGNPDIKVYKDIASINR